MSSGSPLRDKLILFVDDRYEVTQDYMECVADEGAKVIYSNTIEEAFRILSSMLGPKIPPFPSDMGPVGQIDFAVLDLHMRLPNPLPEGLREFSTSFHSLATVDNEKRTLNAGQILGMYINSYLKNVQFVYLSAVAAHYERMPGGESEQEPQCLNRYDTLPKQLADYIIGRLSAVSGQKG